MIMFEALLLSRGYWLMSCWFKWWTRFNLHIMCKHRTCQITSKFELNSVRHLLSPMHTIYNTCVFLIVSHIERYIPTYTIYSPISWIAHSDCILPISKEWQNKHIINWVNFVDTLASSWCGIHLWESLC